MGIASTSRSDRIELRASPDEKALLVKAAAIERLDLTSFVMRTVLSHAEHVVTRAERLEISPRDSVKVMQLLESPPPPPESLIAAARLRLPGNEPTRLGRNTHRRSSRP